MRIIIKMKMSPFKYWKKFQEELRNLLLLIHIIHIIGCSHVPNNGRLDPSSPFWKNFDVSRDFISDIYAFSNKDLTKFRSSGRGNFFADS